MISECVPPAYPMLKFIAAQGMKISVFLALAGGVGGLGLAYVTQIWLLVPVAIVGAVVLMGLLASYVELVRVIVDTMVPR